MTGINFPHRLNQNGKLLSKKYVEQPEENTTPLFAGRLYAATGSNGNAG
jgi:hypothetical protein